MSFRLLLLLLSTVLASCRCVQTALAPEERAWLAPYVIGERLVFRSNYGNLDTLLVASKQEYYTNEDCNWLEVSSFQEHTIALKLLPVHCRPRVTCTMVVSIRKERPEKRSVPFFDMLGLEHAPWIAGNSATAAHSITLSTTNKTYPAAYFFAAGVNATNIGKGYLQSFDWDLTDGLIRYEAQDGEIYELVGK